MLIFKNLSVNLIIKKDLIEKGAFFWFFIQKCHRLTNYINTQMKIIGHFGLHKLIVVLH